VAWVGAGMPSAAMTAALGSSWRTRIVVPTICLSAPLVVGADPPSFARLSWSVGLVPRPHFPMKTPGAVGVLRPETVLHGIGV
jgi:hypothetical protein